MLHALRAAAHVHLGFGSFCQYIERLFGYKPRTTQEKLRVAEALEGLPRMAGALASGHVGWCAARELTRVAVPETEQVWLEAACGKTQRELEALVANKAPGDAPDAGGDGAPRRRVLRFEVEPDTFATFREAMQRLERAAGGRLDHDALLLSMARHVLGGAADEGRSIYQIALHVCSACGGGEQVAGGELVPVDAAVVGMAGCDAQHLGEVLPQAVVQRAANENAGSGGDHGTAANQCSNHAHVGMAQSPAENAPRTGKRPIPRARQSIPPALRRAVLARDRHRCQVPGCSHSTFVDVHHIQRRSEGGLNVIWNLLTLCSAHHRAVHRGELLIERGGDGALVFRHADGSFYGNPAVARHVDVHTKVFSALRHLGFRESAVKAVLAELRGDAALAEATAERLLREALIRIKPSAR